MNPKDKRYWEGIAKAKSEVRPKTQSVEKILEWQDSALEFVKNLKGKIEHEEPTEIELYKRWVSLKRRQ